MIIEAHNHPDWHGHDLNRYLENVTKYGIDKTWLLSWETPADEYDPWQLHLMPSGRRVGKYSTMYLLYGVRSCQNA